MSAWAFPTPKSSKRRSSRRPVSETAGAPGAADTTEPLPAGTAANVVFSRSGQTAAIAAGQTVLEAAEEAGVEIPFECRSGICGQCKTRLFSGRVAMEVQDALTADDRIEGLILACQARAAGDIEVEA